MKDKTYAELQGQLESVIDWFTSESVDVDKAEEKYRQGIEIAQELKKRLDSTENKITKIKQSFDKSA